ncbi:hypothetical protein ABZY58_11910 [Micromonospora tulbaghiae]|uniref:hypothetical protein n=1 Tax=Micromonospora tulbaghiae TaxID=479978 RepID=UPI0033BB8AA2
MPKDKHEWVRTQLDRIAEKLRDEHAMELAYSGMALGPDQWWCRSTHRAGVPYIAHIPYPQQLDRWNQSAQADWVTLVGMAAGEQVYGDLADAADSDRRRLATALLHKRNDGMLAGVPAKGLPPSDAVVAVWIPSKRDGGTYSAVQKAWRRRLPVILLNPDGETVTVPSRDRLGELLGKTNQPALGGVR